MSTASRKGCAAPPPCPCGSGRQLDACCGPCLDGAPAPTAEALMRSRYSAWVLGDAGHLLRTWHARTRPAQLDIDPRVRWLGLQVLDRTSTVDDQAQVSFVARCRLGGASAMRMREISRFVYENGRWWYLDGDTD